MSGDSQGTGDVTVVDGAGTNVLDIVGVSSATTANNTMTVALVAGDLLIVLTHRRTADTNNVMWGATTVPEDVPVASYGPEPMFMSLWSYRATAPGTNTVVASSAASASELFVFILHNSPVTPFDTGIDAGGTSGNASAGPTAMTAIPHELLLGFVGGDAGALFNGAWAAGWVPLENRSMNGVDTTIAYQIVNAQAAYSASYTGFTTRSWGAGIAAYRLP